MAPAEHSLPPATGFYQILVLIVAFAAFTEHPRRPSTNLAEVPELGAAPTALIPVPELGKTWDGSNGNVQNIKGTEGGEGRGAQLCLGAAECSCREEREQRWEREEQEETREGNSAAWRHFLEQDAWASPWRSSGKQLLSRGSSAPTVRAGTQAGRWDLGAGVTLLHVGGIPAGSAQWSPGKGLHLGVPAPKSHGRGKQGGRVKEEGGREGDPALVPMS